MAVWAGVDVGGERKVFDVAVIDDRRVLALTGHLARGQVKEIVVETRPAEPRRDDGTSAQPAPDGNGRGNRRADPPDIR